MANPYIAPTTSGVDKNPPAALRWVAIGLSIVAIIILLVTVGMLIPQAMRFGNENVQLPPRLQGSTSSQRIATASWIVGIAAAIGVVMNMASLFMVRGGKTAIPIVLAVSSLALLMVTAIAFKPI
jgi:hypothetical protein